MRPAVERTLAAFGDPLASMRDLGRAGARAVTGCPQRGSQISRSRVRSQLRDLLRKARSAQRVRADLPALLLWILEGEGYKHLPYPFSLPHRDFFRRCEQFPHQRDRRLPRPRTLAELGLLRQASQALADLQRLNSKAAVAARLDHNWTQFRSLRSVLRLSAEELPRGACPARSLPREPEEAAARLQAITSDLRRYRKNLRQRVRTAAAQGLGPSRSERIILRYLDRYGDGLCGHPVARDAEGRAVAVVDRTNNVIEQFFGRAKQGLRRRLGRAHLGREMEDQPAHTALIANLRHPDYVQILCGTLDQLPQAFAQLDRQTLSRPPRLQRKNRNEKLRRRNRARARDARRHPPLNTRKTPLIRQERQVAN